MQNNLSSTNHPYVTVIVPVYNDAARIKVCIEALLAQTYPHDSYEILVVDNGSNDATPSVIAQYPVTLLTENQVRGSYAARNKALRQARGSIIAFTDADCIPVTTWLTEGVRALQKGADLAGGRVRFICSTPPTGAEIYDTLFYLQIDQHVAVDKGAATANLFVKAELFQQLGLFPQHIQSGCDMYWTRKAVANGYKLVYAELAEIAHPARRLKELLRKQHRIGTGVRDIRHLAKNYSESSIDILPRQDAENLNVLQKVTVNLRELLPPRIAFVHQAAQRQQLRLSPFMFLRLWGAVWAARVATVIGNLPQPQLRLQQVNRNLSSRARSKH